MSVDNIADSGHRRQFDTGAVRDIQDGKGRCDLLPLRVVGEFLGFTDNSPDVLTKCFELIDNFIEEKRIAYIYSALDNFATFKNMSVCDMILDVAKHYENGSKKYGEKNWMKGIPTHCYIDSGVRHLLKFIGGYVDEPHDRAFVWNMLGLIYTFHTYPELDDVIPVSPPTIPG